MTKEIPSNGCADLLDGTRPCVRAEKPCRSECTLAALTLRVLGVSDVSRVTPVRHGNLVGVSGASGSGVSVRYVGRVEEGGMTVGLNGCDAFAAGLVASMTETPSTDTKPSMSSLTDSTDVLRGDDPNSTGAFLPSRGGSHRKRTT